MAAFAPSAHAPSVFLEREEFYGGWLVAIVGPEASGRYSAAVWFANELLRRSFVHMAYVIADESVLEEHYLLAQAPPGSQRLFIVTDVLARSKSLVKRLLHSRGDLGAGRKLLGTLRGSRLLLTISPE